MTDCAEVSDTCLLNSGTTIDPEGQRNTLAVSGADKENEIVMNVLKTVDAEHSSISPQLLSDDNSALCESSNGLEDGG